MLIDCLIPLVIIFLVRPVMYLSFCIKKKMAMLAMPHSSSFFFKTKDKIKELNVELQTFLGL